MDAGADAERKRLRWRCRRGMRELDVLLERYLAEVWPGAGEAQRRAFAALLEWPDPELAALCFGRRSTTDPEIAAVVAAWTRLRTGEGPGGEASGGGSAGDPRLLES
jgi:antitoxin CptB